MRQEAVSLIQQAMGARCRAYVLVNNRTEGNAPLTIQALVDLLTEPTLQGGKAIYESEN
jgi:hypothetical protein